jgi:superfamily I DNA/RNA helicase
MAENSNTMNDYVGFKLAGGVKRYNLNLLSEVGIMGQGKEVKDPFLRAFRSFTELVAYSVTAGDQELTSAIGFQDRYRAAASGIAKSIRGNNLETTLRSENGGRMPHHSKIPAHVTISSAHRSKGLEADIVVVWDDYKTWSKLIDGYKDFETDETTRSEFEQEINLVYVAVTRAKNTLFLPSKLSAIVNQKNLSNILPD